MARRRFQDPRLELVGEWYEIRVYEDEYVNGRRIRKRKRVKLAPASMPIREVQKVRAEYLRRKPESDRADSAATSHGCGSKGWQGYAAIFGGQVGPTGRPCIAIGQGWRTDARHNILTRHIKPAARKLGIEWANWQVLRRSYATWLRMVGTDPRDRQSLMRHSRFTTTAEIYEQDLPESQVNAVEKLGSLVN